MPPLHGRMVHPFGDRLRLRSYCGCDQLLSRGMVFLIVRSFNPRAQSTEAADQNSNVFQCGESRPKPIFRVEDVRPKTKTEVSSRPERSEVEGPAVHHPYKQATRTPATLPFDNPDPGFLPRGTRH